MFRSGLLLLPPPFNGALQKIPLYLSSISKHVKDTLYVHLLPESAPSLSPPPPVLYTPDAQKLVISLYSKAASHCSHLDVRVLLPNIANVSSSVSPHQPHHGFEVILMEEQARGTNEQLLKYVNSRFPSNTPCKTITSIAAGSSQTQLVADRDNDIKKCKMDDTSCKVYDNVVLGGTFDRLHAGHKILLSQACMMAGRKLTVGVTEPNMNKKKTLCELIEPTVKRISAVKEFLSDVKHNIDYEVVPIIDPFGPSIIDPDLECIVVSEETRKGGDAVNRKRQEKGLSILDVFEIALVEDDNRSPEEETKISSSSMRKRLLGTVFHPIKGNNSIPSSPYVIGLTGGMASGKSSVCKRLKKLGAAIIDCDELGHMTYKKGSPTFRRMVETFGEDIINENGDLCRKTISGKVFFDPTQGNLKKLNSIVWPAIVELAKARIQEYAKEGTTIIVLDAAVLLEAGWDKMTHEVWDCTIPRDEAVLRIMNRDARSESEANSRIAAQLTNEDRISRANVILSTLWEPEVTQLQVEKAWHLLQRRITEVPQHRS